MLTGSILDGRKFVVGAAIPSLVRWGCSPDADLVYRAAHSGVLATSGSIARTLGLSKARVDRALEELCAAGAVAVQAHSPARASRQWAMRPPGEVLQRLRQRRIRDSSNANRAAIAEAMLRTSLTGMMTLGDGARHLPTRELTRRRLSEIVAAEQHEHLSMNPEQEFDAPSARAAAPLDRQLAERGIKIRAIGRPPADGDPQLPGEPPPPNVAYRETGDIPMKLIVADRRVALFPVDHRDLEKGYLELGHAPVVTSLVALFGRHWQEAVDPWEFGMARIVLDERERALVGLLAAGHTDSSAARELGIATRTVTNILRSLMDQLGVENRFQLGLALGTLRAAPPPPGIIAPRPPAKE